MISFGTMLVAVGLGNSVIAPAMTVTRYRIDLGWDEMSQCIKTEFELDHDPRTDRLIFTQTEASQQAEILLTAVDDGAPKVSIVVKSVAVDASAIVASVVSDGHGPRLANLTRSAIGNCAPQ